MSLPSIHVRSCATIRRSISRCAVSLLGVMASTSSRKRMHGASFFLISGVAGAQIYVDSLWLRRMSLVVFSPTHPTCLIRYSVPRRTRTAVPVPVTISGSDPDVRLERWVDLLPLDT